MNGATSDHTAVAAAAVLRPARRLVSAERFTGRRIEARPLKLGPVTGEP